MLLACVTTTSASPSSLMVKAEAHEPSASYFTVCLPRSATHPALLDLVALAGRAEPELWALVPARASRALSQPHSSSPNPRT